LPRPPSSTLFPYTTLFRSDRRGAEALGPVASHQQVVDRLPLETELAVGGLAEVAVVRVAGGKAELQQLRTRHVGQHRQQQLDVEDRKSTRLNSSHVKISYA